MRNVKIIGMGNSLAGEKVVFRDQTRYKLAEGETQLSLAVEACNKALKAADMTVNEIDCIVGACAMGIQHIPVSAVLISEQLAPERPIPCLDINTICSSFITALDTMSYLVAAGRYNNVLIISADVPSLRTNPNQRESYELFSDAASAFIITRDETGNSHVINGIQRTYVEGAHDTEIRAGLSVLPPQFLNEENREEFLFDMKGKKAMALTAKGLPVTVDEFYSQCGVTLQNVDYIVPHQASKALGIMMNMLGVEPERYADNVSKYGNMVSASIPYTFCECVDQDKINRGDTVLLFGTAAGLSINMLALRY
ncbi:MAG: 3-oxoacyl-[acyl-carrier-protein] synthase III C-terminal domain-containing protein [Methanobacterium sp.]